MLALLAENLKYNISKKVQKKRFFQVHKFGILLKRF